VAGTSTVAASAYITDVERTSIVSLAENIATVHLASCPGAIFFKITRLLQKLLSF